MRYFRELRLSGHRIQAYDDADRVPFQVVVDLQK